jgi:hypothetical protein
MDEPELAQEPSTDPAVQTGGFDAPTPGPGGGGDSYAGSFDGLDFANWGAGHPPDTNGDVGPEYYIQTVNTSIGMWRKSDGARVAAFTFNTFMSQATWPAGNLCPTNNFGDPVVVYDSFNDRWVITDFAFTLSAQGNPVLPYQQCFAVSQTGDPVSGGWNFYSLTISDLFGDYPKFGVWNNGVINGLFMTANMFTAAGSFRNVRAYGFDLGAMEAGSSIVNVLSANLPTGSTVFTGLPGMAHAVTGAPPTGRNETITVIFSAKNARVWQLQTTNFTSGTLSGPSTVTLATWTVAPASVASPANRLDSLQERLMAQSQYVNLGGTEAIWLSHSVANPSATSLAAPRWYQLNYTGGTVTTSGPLQQSTWAPDSTLSRWMPSLAVDKNNDMAIGYSVTSSTVNPRISWAGRLSTDPANTLGQTETTLVAGTGSQSGNCGSSACIRWGDYSAMTIDPDGCTFWYTNEYYAVTGLNDLTKIGSFKFPSCTPNKFNTTVTPSSASGIYGGTVSLSATLKRGTVALSGKTVSFTLNGNSVGSATTNSSGVATLSSVSLSGINAGSYPTGVGASFAGDSIYNSSSGTNSLTVAKANQTITFPAIPTHTFGDLDFNPGATASSGLAVSYSASGNCSIVSGAVHITGAGSCTVTAHQGGDSNYNAAPDVDQTFTIHKANQTISFGALANKTYGDADFGVSATASSGDAVSFTASGSCTVSGSTVSLTGAGSCTITAHQGGNANYNAAPDVSQSFSIAKANSHLTANPASGALNGTTSLSAQLTGINSGALSGETITFTLNGTPVGSATTDVSGSATLANVSLAGILAGNYPTGVGASFGGDANYNGSSASNSLHVGYNFSGFLQPINDTAHQVGVQMSVFKAGSTVPVKFQLMDATGHIVQANTLPIWLTPVNAGPLAASVNETTYTDSPSSGSAFRWDPTSQQYIYNWNTAKSQAGSYWQIGVKLDDGSTQYVMIGLK